MFLSVFLFPPSPGSLSTCNTLQKCVPTKDVLLTRAVLFAVCSFLQLPRVCLQTNRMGQLVSLTVCSADRSMGITVNTLSCFCRVVECLSLMDTPIGCFSSPPDEGFAPPGDGLSIPGCSKWSESPSTKSIGFSRSPSFSVYYFLTRLDKVFLYALMERTLVGSINQVINGLWGAGWIESQGGAWDWRVRFCVWMASH